MGSVAHEEGFVIRARLIDLQTGLVLQTAKMAAAAESDLIAVLPQLAVLLQMSDDQRLAYERQIAHQATAVPIVAELTDVPPPPDNPSAAGPPVVFSTSRPPDLGGVVIEDFRQLPQNPSPGQAAVETQLALSIDHKVRGRALNVAVNLGDEFFRRGRYQEAQAQFQVALNLAPGQHEVRVRLDQCKPHVLSPAFGQPEAAVHPRVAVLDFVTAGEPALVPPGLGAWAAEAISPYLSTSYSVADRGEVYWYMGSLGVTLRDAVVDPVARFYLGRALNVRFVVLGTVQATANGFQVAAHLLDTETGTEVNTATAVAKDRGELKCRVGEIAQWLLLDPAERIRRQNEAAEIQALLAQAESAANLSNFSLAIELAKKAEHKTPGIRAELLLNQFDRQSQSAALETERRAAWEKNQALIAAAARRQQELAAAAETARVAAARQSASIDAAERQRRRDLAYKQLIVQARAASDAQDLTVAIQLYDSALAIDRKSQAIIDREKVLARAADQARTLTTVDSVRREAARRQERAADAVQVRRSSTPNESSRRLRSKPADKPESRRTPRSLPAYWPTPNGFRRRATSTPPCERCNPRNDFDRPMKSIASSTRCWSFKPAPPHNGPMTRLAAIWTQSSRPRRPPVRRRKPSAKPNCGPKTMSKRKPAPTPKPSGKPTLAPRRAPTREPKPRPRPNGKRTLGPRPMRTPRLAPRPIRPLATPTPTAASSRTNSGATHIPG